MATCPFSKKKCDDKCGVYDLVHKQCALLSITMALEEANIESDEEV